MSLKSVVRDFTPPILLRLVRPPKGFGYIDCKTVIANAKAAGMSVPFYLHRHWGTEPGTIDRFMSHLNSIIPLAQCENILEIGAGAGLWLEPIMKLARSKNYSVYEIDSDWSSYLASTYGVTTHYADGKSLAATPDRSQDLIHSHYVFNYLPVVVAFSYFHEIFRTCRQGGHVVFDCFPDNRYDLAAIERWLQYDTTYQVLLPKTQVLELFAKNGFSLVSDQYEFQRPNELNTTYLIFRKRP